jgi:hypothetical protein
MLFHKSPVGDTILIRKDQVIGDGFANAGIEGRILSPVSTVVPNVLNRVLKKRQVIFDDLLDLRPRSVVGDNDFEIRDGLPQVSDKRKGKKAGLVVGGDDYAGDNTASFAHG